MPVAVSVTPVTRPAAKKARRNSRELDSPLRETQLARHRGKGCNLRTKGQVVALEVNASAHSGIDGLGQRNIEFHLQAGRPAALRACQPATGPDVYRAVANVVQQLAQGTRTLAVDRQMLIGLVQLRHSCRDVGQLVAVGFGPPRVDGQPIAIKHNIRLD